MDRRRGARRVALAEPRRYDGVVSTSAAPSTVSEAEYLAMERASSTKHELWNGEVFAMMGGTLAHAMLIANAIGMLGSALRDRGCRVLSSDAKIRVPLTRAFVYPDVSVVCGAMQTYEGSDDVLCNPRVEVELPLPELYRGVLDGADASGGADASAGSAGSDG